MSSNRFSQLLRKYQTVLESLQDDQSPIAPERVLAVLQIRDTLQFLFNDPTHKDPKEIFHLFDLDEQLKQLAPKINKALKLENWRASVLPSKSSWWWFLDDATNTNKKQTEVVRNILIGTLLVFIISLAVDIIQRFWINSSDTISILGTLLTVLLTASPFVKQGQEFSEWLLRRLPFIQSKNLYDIRLKSAGFTLIVLLVLRLWLIPGPLASYYNNNGAKAREDGHLGIARQMFQRAAALNPNHVVPYQNIADAYKDMGLEDQAIEWYQKALEQNANFTPAYRGLGELYNRQEKYMQAEQVLLAGLNIESKSNHGTMEKVTQYELLANLGWSYWGQNKFDIAQITLEKSLELETDLKMMGDAQGVEYRLALPHFYLAQIYEQNGNMDLARYQWEECLRFLEQEDWRQSERYFIVQEHLQSPTK